MERRVISGEPGERYTNETDRILYRWNVTWHNSCAVCIAHDGLIGDYWPIPIHRNCSCNQTPIYPGQTAEPFVDFREKIREISPAQQAHVMGRANLTLVESGIVSWDDVVTTGRIRSLREVVARQKLTVPQMVRAGVRPQDAKEAFDAVNTRTHTRAEASRIADVAALRAKGFTRQQIVDAAGRAIGQRIGLSGPSGIYRIPPSTILTPRVVVPPVPANPPPPERLDMTEQEYREYLERIRQRLRDEYGIEFGET